MLDLLYNYKRLGYALKDIRNDLKGYVEQLSVSTGVNAFSHILNTINIDTTDMSLDELILYVKDHIELTYFKNEYVLQDGTRYVNKTVGEIASYISAYYGQNGAQIMDAKKYMFMYLKWFYTSVDDIVCCILNNSSVDDIQVVGPRTREYLEVVGLHKYNKRFGTPKKRQVVPLSFYSGHHFIGSPPITINTWGKEVIEKVYHALGYKNIEYVRTKGSWVFARPDVSSLSMGTYFPCSQLMRLDQRINDPTDILASMAYDYFLLYCIDMFSNMEIVLANVLTDVDSIISLGLTSPAVSSALVEYMKYKDDVPNVIGMMNIIY